MKIEFSPIGTVRSPLKTTGEAPRHHSVSRVEGIIEVNPDLADGLFRIGERTHLVVLFYFHSMTGPIPLRQEPPTGSGEKGVFSTCSPRRPNPIGMDIVELVRVEGNLLHVRNIDMIDGTPVLDIKPFKIEDLTGL